MNRCVTGKAFDANHPFHLHGHAFRVIAMERINSTTTVEEVKARDKAGLIRRKLKRAPIKDTITVPDGGFTIVRVRASNPGL
jgi:FtsP/CotA-like multicopper oxidase with cupredoxin domain